MEGSASAPKSAGGGSKMLVIAIVVILIIAAVAAAVILMMGGDEPEPEPTNLLEKGFKIRARLQLRKHGKADCERSSETRSRESESR